MSPKVLFLKLPWMGLKHPLSGVLRSLAESYPLSRPFLHIAQGQVVLEAAVKPNAGGRWVPKDTGTRPETK